MASEQNLPLCCSLQRGEVMHAGYGHGSVSYLLRAFSELNIRMLLIMVIPRTAAR